MSHVRNSTSGAGPVEIDRRVEVQIEREPSPAKHEEAEKGSIRSL
jgi:hypothetical protein